LNFERSAPGTGLDFFNRRDHRFRCGCPRGLWQ
jgi:hypothetical protein